MCQSYKPISNFIATFDLSFLHIRCPNGVHNFARVLSNDVCKTGLNGECVVVCGGDPVHESLCE